MNEQHAARIKQLAIANDRRDTMALYEKAFETNDDTYILEAARTFFTLDDAIRDADENIAMYTKSDFMYAHRYEYIKEVLTSITTLQYDSIAAGQTVKLKVNLLWR